jgi:hypothetical protein
LWPFALGVGVSDERNVSAHDNQPLLAATNLDLG